MIRREKQGSSLILIFALSIVSSLIFMIFVGSNIYFADEPKKYISLALILFAMVLFAIRKDLYTSYAFFCGIVFVINFAIINIFYSQDSYVIGSSHKLMIPDMFMVLGACLLLFSRSPKASSKNHYSLSVIVSYIVFLWYLLAISIISSDSTYAMIHLAHNGRVVIIFLIFCIVFRRKPEAIKYLIMGLSFLVIVQGVVGICQQYGVDLFLRFTDAEFSYISGGFNRVGGTLGRVHLHTLLVMTLPVLLAQALWLKNGKFRLLLVLAVTMGIITIGLTRNRGPLMAFLFASGYVFYNFYKFRIIGFSPRVLIFATLGFTLLSGSFMIGGENYEQIFLRPTYLGRIEQNKSILKNFYNAPPLKMFFGYGSNQFILDSYGMESHEKSSRDTKRVFNAHNQYLLLLYETGIFGLFLYFLWAFLFFKQAKLHRKYDSKYIVDQKMVVKIGISGSLLCLFLNALTKPIHDNISFTLLGIYMAFIAPIHNISKRDEKKSS
jgi:O-antigen ligase